MTSSFVHISLISLLLNLLITIWAFYSAWVNFVQQRITTFGPDVFLIFWMHLITKKKIKKLREEPNLPKRMGIAMILLGLSTLRIVIMYFMQK